MILWILAVFLLVSLGVAGYYQGAIRAAASFLGLIIAAVLAVPLGNLIAPILTHSLFNATNFLWLLNQMNK